MLTVGSAPVVSAVPAVVVIVVPVPLKVTHAFDTRLDRSVTFCVSTTVPSITVLIS